MAEAVGIVLAIAPLVISAYEHYGETAQCIKRYRDYTRSVKRLAKSLNIQGTIFRTANARLLAHCVDKDHARLMLDDRAHPSWKDPQIAAAYLARLADSRDAFVDSIDLIIEHLTGLQSKIEDFQKLCDQSPKPREGGALRSIGKKIKFAFSEPHVVELLEQLRSETEDFCTLVDQTQPLQDSQPTLRPTLDSQKQIARFAKVKDAADNLYQALGQACTKHTGHRAHISLHPTYADPAQIRFTIAFSQLTLQSREKDRQSSSKSTWLTVESSVSGRLHSTTDSDAAVSLRAPAKRIRENSSPERPSSSTKVKTKKSVRFSCALPNAALLCPDLGPPTSHLLNLCTNGNFCTQLHNFITQAKPSTNAIGYLEHHGSAKHLIYVDSKWQSVTRSNDDASLKSLHHLLKAAADARQASVVLLPRERVCLARQLATALLQFQATPWLREQWTSNDVLIPELMSDGTDTPEPYVSVAIQGLNSPSSKVIAKPCRTLIRDPLVFSLGVMLLELAFQKPLSAMRIGADVDTSDDHITDYHTANRLRRQVSACLGPRYAEVTRKCIHCVFGDDSELKTDTKLQAAFYQEVIRVLEEVEERLRHL